MMIKSKGVTQDQMRRLLAFALAPENQFYIRRPTPAHEDASPQARGIGPVIYLRESKETSRNYGFSIHDIVVDVMDDHFGAVGADGEAVGVSSKTGRGEVPRRIVDGIFDALDRFPDDGDDAS